MKTNFTKQGEILIASFFNSHIDRSLIQRKMEGCKHLIIDLSKIDSINDVIIQNFTTFGDELINNNSFLIVLKGSFKDKFPIVPTLDEAFDYIEMEDIERALKF